MAIIITIGGRWTVLAAAFTDRRLVLRLLVAAVLLTANWTSYVWAVSNDHVIEAALGYFMAPLATMLLGVMVLHEPATRAASSCAMALAAAGRRRAHDLLRPPARGRRDHRRLLEPLRPAQAADPADRDREPGRRDVPAHRPGGRRRRRDGRARRQHPGARRPDGSGCSSPSPGVVTAVPLLLFAFAAQRVPFTLLGALQYLVPTINLVLGWFVYDESMPADRARRLRVGLGRARRRHRRPGPTQRRRPPRPRRGAHDGRAG